VLLGHFEENFDVPASVIEPDYLFIGKLGVG